MTGQILYVALLKGLSGAAILSLLISAIFHNIGRDSGLSAIRGQQYEHSSCMYATENYLLLKIYYFLPWSGYALPLPEKEEYLEEAGTVRRG